MLRRCCARRPTADWSSSARTMVGSSSDMPATPSRRSCVACECWLAHCCDNRVMDLGLRDRACVITGASRGIGLATARGLAGEGASLLLVGRDGDALVRAAAETGGERTETLALDVTDADAG